MASSTSRPSRITWTTGLVAALLLTVTVLFSWPAIERHSWLLRLREEPSLLESCLLSSRESTRQAADRFLREVAGRQELFELYIWEFDRTVVGEGARLPGPGRPDPGVRSLLRRYRSNRLSHGILALPPRGYTMRTAYAGRRGFNTAHVGLAPSLPLRREAILSRLDHLVGRTWRTEQLPGMEFRVVPLEAGKPQSADWSDSSARPRAAPAPPVTWSRAGGEGPGHLCFLRVVLEPGESPPASQSGRTTPRRLPARARSR